MSHPMSASMPEHDTANQPAATLQMRQGIAWVQLNRPERGNALSSAVVHAALAAVAQACAAPDIHTLVLTGAGRNLCTGFDLGGLEDQSEGDLLLRFVQIETLLDALWRAPVRTVALASGRAWGAGADLFAACDLRLLTPDANFRFPGAGFGLVLGTRRLAERVGVERARSWVSEGVSIDSAAALSSGLAHRAVEEPTSADADPFERIRSLCGNHPAIDRDTMAAIRSASRTGGAAHGDALADADMAALVRSAARSGLKQRIIAYRDRSNPTSRRPA